MFGRIAMTFLSAEAAERGVQAMRGILEEEGFSVPDPLVRRLLAAGLGEDDWDALLDGIAEAARVCHVVARAADGGDMLAKIRLPITVLPPHVAARAAEELKAAIRAVSPSTGDAGRRRPSCPIFVSGIQVLPEWLCEPDILLPALALDQVLRASPDSGAEMRLRRDADALLGWQVVSLELPGSESTMADMVNMCWDPIRGEIDFDRPIINLRRWLLSHDESTPEIDNIDVRIALAI
jgi:hypothetical protein